MNPQIKIYLACMAIGIISAWVIQLLDKKDGQGFALVVGVMSVVPYLNMLVAVIALMMTGIAALASIIMLPSLLREAHKEIASKRYHQK